MITSHANCKILNLNYFFFYGPTSPILQNIWKIFKQNAFTYWRSQISILKLFGIKYILQNIEKRKISSTENWNVYRVQVYMFTIKYYTSQSTFFDLMYVQNYLIGLRIYRFTWFVIIFTYRYGTPYCSSSPKDFVF